VITGIAAVAWFRSGARRRDRLAIGVQPDCRARSGGILIPMVLERVRADLLSAVGHFRHDHHDVVGFSRFSASPRCGSD